MKLKKIIVFTPKNRDMTEKDFDEMCSLIKLSDKVGDNIKLKKNECAIEKSKYINTKKIG